MPIITGLDLTNLPSLVEQKPVRLGFYNGASYSFNLRSMNYYTAVSTEDLGSTEITFVALERDKSNAKGFISGSSSVIGVGESVLTIYLNQIKDMLGNSILDMSNERLSDMGSLPKNTEVSDGVLDMSDELILDMLGSYIFDTTPHQINDMSNEPILNMTNEHVLQLAA